MREGIVVGLEEGWDEIDGFVDGVNDGNEDSDGLKVGLEVDSVVYMYPNLPLNNIVVLRQ